LRRWLAQAVALALLLPALIGLLPQPALSAASAFERDLLLSVCGENAPQQGGGHHQSSHDHCVLCGSNCSSLSPSLANAEPAFTAAPRRSDEPTVTVAATLAPPLQARLDASPPRGPPTLS
jgi:hypothetical protein